MKFYDISLERKILDEISVDRAFEDIKAICEIGEKIAGSSEEGRFVEYISRRLNEAGVEHDIYTFKGYVSMPIEAKLKIIYPIEKEIPCQVYAQSACTPPEGIEGEIVYVGSGGIDDYKGRDVKGKITLAELSYSPPRPEKVRIAQEKGAIAQIQINWGLIERKLLPRGTVKSIWGNPTPDDIPRITRIPAVGITKADGAFLKDLIEKEGKVKVWLMTKTWRGFKDIHDIIAYVKGSKASEKFIILNGHFDCWGPGATDNAVGNAALLEFARVFTKYRDYLRRSIRLAWWSGHESGIMDGSTWYVDNFWDDINKNCVGWLNIDSTGMKGSERFWAMATEGLHEFIAKTITDVDGMEPVEVHRLIKVGDASALGVGVPHLMTFTAFPREEIIREVGRYTPIYLGWWYHGPEDSIDKIDLKAYERSLKVYAALSLRFVNLPILPYKFSEATEKIVNYVKEIKKLSGGIVNLNRIEHNAIELNEKVKKFEERVREKIDKATTVEDLEMEEINNVLMKLSRYIVPLMYTYDAGRYGQDPYGLTHLEYTVPNLSIIEELTKIPRDTDEFYMYLTKAVRKINLVSDQLEEASKII
ncbi:M28 family peptidase [Candidatus Methanodesulfokora washburnensis]|uniref:M28 family peptidase n=1 Tax=Candidatus Methanodesulfokora washburnensis TaxID=2478471 RepID=A0A3R9PDG5_9CREN|nr:M28 family peptidase [Candidatus Methanodesulfokores washburnensis]RSN73394.1 M28 family peptidase [Candidatus Methanodesulfokores washburnensis]